MRTLDALLGGIAATTLCLVAVSSAQAQDAPQGFPATLRGHAVIPAYSFVVPPTSAPAFLRTSGKFTDKTRQRLDSHVTQGNALPFAGQPLQGFSGIKALGDGRYLVLTDNGFGNLPNSPDAMLMVHEMTPDFETGTVAVHKTTFLSDPDHVLPYRITLEGTAQRYLTGADFDIEGVQPLGDRLWFGDEFGPFVFSTDQDGVVKSFFETRVGDLYVQSPDHPLVRTPSTPGGAVTFNAKRSRGYEGFAAAVDGSMLYPLLEGPVFFDDQPETVADGRTALRILEFDPQAGAFTGTFWTYPLEAPGHAIGDFNMIDETRGLVIERDWGQGDADLACADGQEDGCFKEPAGFKRVYMIDMAGVEPGQPVHKVGYIDLLDIQDPDGVARLGQRDDGRFTFPFVTIEDVDRVDGTHIIVANDNNLPFSKGRSLDEPDSNEFILLEVADFLKAHAGE